MAWAQVKKKPYADYDPCPRPMAWARVKKESKFNDLPKEEQDKFLKNGVIQINKFVIINELPGILLVFHKQLSGLSQYLLYICHE